MRPKETEALYRMIFCRRNVRQFTSQPVAASDLKKIRNYISGLPKLVKQPVRLALASAEEVRADAPHCILAWCEKQPAAYAAAGFLLELCDLYVQSLGLGAGWSVSYKPKTNTEDFCIALGFGQTDVPFRNGAADFKRRILDKPASADAKLAEAVRLAPSSLNSQPWQLKEEPGKVIIEEQGHGWMRFLLASKLNKIDVGIAACHAWLALQAEGKKPDVPENGTWNHHFALIIPWQE